MLRLIAAINDDGMIDGFPPLKADLQRFAALTTGGTVIMGRKTWDSLPVKPLKHRLNIVVTHNAAKIMDIMDSAKDHMVLVAPSIPVALHIAEANDGSAPWIIGGGQIYEQTIDQCDALYLSHVKGIGGSVPFPTVGTGFERVMNQKHPDHDFAIWHRIQS